MTRDYTMLFVGILVTLNAGADILGIHPRGMLGDVPVLGTVLYGPVPFAIGICIVIYESIALVSGQRNKKENEKS